MLDLIYLCISVPITLLMSLRVFGVAMGDVVVACVLVMILFSLIRR